ncbi:hypothetical protein ACIGC1_28990 [Peribacillus butanolivorans]|uniref:hypothetical protein n=1 Tax=Peribacillus butanolivorans TaxID=421767 RepID=UPI0037C7B914
MLKGKRFLFFQNVAAVVVNIIIEMKLPQIMQMDNLEMESELSEPKNLSVLLVKLLANKIKKVKLICFLKNIDIGAKKRFTVRTDLSYELP